MHPIFSFVFLFNSISAITDPSLLFANRGDIRLANLSSANTSALVFTKGIEDASSVDFIFDEGKFCWIDIAIEEVRCHHFDTFFTAEPRRMVFDARVFGGGGGGSGGGGSGGGGGARDDSVMRPQGLALDWVTGNLYWTDSLSRRLQVVSGDGRLVRGLFWTDIDEPRAIALLPARGLLFWTDWGATPKIEVASMDGEPGSRRIFVSTDIVWPNGITIDYESELVYWSDANKKWPHISYQHVDGSGRRVVTANRIFHPYSVTIYHRRLLWTDWKTLSIHSVDKELGGAVVDVLSGGKSGLQPLDVHIYSAARQPRQQLPAGCASCQQLCLLSSAAAGASTCSCATGLRPINNTHCTTEHERVLLLNIPGKMGVLTLDTADRWYYPLPVGPQLYDQGSMIDYDPVHDHLYWFIDESIKRVRLPAAGSVQVQAGAAATADGGDGDGQHTVLHTGAEQLGSLAVDWVARTVYWSDIALRRIEVARLDMTARKVVVSDSVDEPRLLALAPLAGLMFWCDWHERRPRIERANLDGGERRALVDTEIRWPNGLALDQAERRVYWTDADSGRIEVCAMDGSGRRVLLSDSLPHPFGVSVLGDSVYWSDVFDRTVQMANKLTGEGRQVIASRLSNVVQLKAVQRHWHAGTNPCAVDNGGCSHLCLYTPHGARCHCPIGMELRSDLVTCFVAETLLLFSQNGSVSHMGLEAANRQSPLPLHHVTYVTSMGVDVVSGLLYWTDRTSRSVWRADISGSRQQRLVQLDDDQLPHSVAVDWLAGNIYWLVLPAGHIELSRLDGAHRRVLLWDSVYSPRQLALDVHNSLLFWSDRGQQSAIYRARLDATGRQPLVPLGTGPAVGLTVDPASSRLFWLETVSADEAETAVHLRSVLLLAPPGASVDSWRLAGGGGGTWLPSALAVAGSHVFWADGGRRTIERADKLTGAARRTLLEAAAPVTDLLVYQRQQAGAPTPDTACGATAAAAATGCSQLCFNVRRDSELHAPTRRCGCQSQYLLQPDGRSCAPPVRFLLYALGATLRRHVFGGGGGGRGGGGGELPDMSLAVRLAAPPLSLAYDTTNRHIYWIDQTTSTILRARESGDSSSVFLSSRDIGALPHSIQVDFYSGMIYWSCAVHNVINVTRLNGSSVGTVVGGADDTTGVRPRHIALLPQTGHLVFVNWLARATVELVLLDGSARRVLSRPATRPTALTTDHQHATIYWAEQHAIWSTDLLGNSRSVVSGELVNVVGLAVLGPALYWLDRGSGLLERAVVPGPTTPAAAAVHQQQQQRRRRLTVVSGAGAATALLAVEHVPRRTVSAHPCYGNWLCSHLCLPNIGGGGGAARCSCPRGLALLEDGRTCRPVQQCAISAAGGQWHCQSTHAPPRVCVPTTVARGVCSGGDAAECVRDVGGGRGATGGGVAACPVCPRYHVPCLPSDSCPALPQTVCSSQVECGGGGGGATVCCDERDFYCRVSRQCVPASAVCDRVSDCRSGEDELASSCRLAAAARDHQEQQREEAAADSATGSGWLLLVSLCSATAALILSGAVLWWCRCRSQRHAKSPPHATRAATATLERHHHQLHHHHRQRRQSARREAVPMMARGESLVAPPPVPPPSCQRSHTVYSSVCAGGPPLNPPPSPATSGAPASSCGYYRLCSRPPPPTPCSTDVCHSDSAERVCRGAVGGARAPADSDYESDSFLADRPVAPLPPAPPPSVSAIGHHQSRRPARPEAPPPSPVNEQYVL